MEIHWLTFLNQGSWIPTPFIKFIIRLLLLLLHEKAIPQFTPWERIFIFKMPADSNGNSKIKLSKVMRLQLQNTRCFFLIGCMPCLSRISTFYCICYMHPSLAGSSAHSQFLLRHDFCWHLAYWSFSRPLTSCLSASKSLVSPCSIPGNLGGVLPGHRGHKTLPLQGGLWRSSFSPKELVGSRGILSPCPSSIMLKK